MCIAVEGSVGAKLQAARECEDDSAGSKVCICSSRRGLIRLLCALPWTLDYIHR